MAEWSSRNIMLTTKGAAAISKVQSGIGKLTITRVVASEQYVPESTLRGLTSLSVENLPLTIIDRHEVPDGGSVIQVQLSNLDLANSFIFNEIGVFATHSDNPSEEFLYIIAQVDADTGDRIPLYSTTPITATYDIYLYNVGADDIEVTITSSGLVTVQILNQAVQNHNTSNESHPDIRVLINSLLNNHKNNPNAHETEVAQKIQAHNTSINSHLDLRQKINEANNEIKKLWGNDLIEKTDNELTLSNGQTGYPVRMILTEDDEITFGDNEFFTQNLEYDSDGNIMPKAI